MQKSYLVARMAKTAEEFYVFVMKTLIKAKIPFMIGGTYALGEHANLYRATKDLDLFCKASDYPRIIDVMNKSNFRTEITDERWLVRTYNTKFYVDFIFNSPNGLTPVDDTWLKYAPLIKFLKLKVKIAPIEELIWNRIYFQDRERFDGADINHMILKKGKVLNWSRLMLRMEAHWELLLGQLINFRFVYPSERTCVPKWVMEELVKRLSQQLQLPASLDKVCRGPLLTRTQYEIDLKEWGYQVIT